MKDRIPVEEEMIDSSFVDVAARLELKLAKKGTLSFASKHEILGVFTEEYTELVNAVHNKDIKNIKEELTDLAVAAIFGLASIRAARDEF